MKYGNYIIDENNNTSIAKIVKTIKNNSNVIELGSSYGYILDYLKNSKKCTVQGYEIDNEAVALANNNGIPTECIDLDTVTNNFFETLKGNIDYIICADVLEHLKDMNNLLKLISLYLEKNSQCKLLVSFPNITYYGVIEQLIHGNFKYKDLGILDRTHLQFYDKYELEKTFNLNNLETIVMHKIDVEPQNSEFKIALNNQIVDILEKNGHEDYLTYQYVFELQYCSNPVPKIISTTTKQSIIENLHNKKDEQIMELNTMVNKKDEQIMELNTMVNKKDEQIMELNTMVNKKDEQIMELNTMVNKKDEQIMELNTMVNKKDEQIIELNSIAHQLQDRIRLLEFPPIDISIVTYNSKKWLDAFLNSLIKQAYPLNKLNLYITDNSSTDDTYAYLEVLKETYAEAFASFNLRKEKNLGFGHGHNNNFKYAKSKFILATNVDLEFEVDAIVNVVDYALQDESSTASWEFRQKPYEHPKYYNPVTLETTWSSSACILFRKEAIDKIGGYDDHIFMYGEDVELSYRLRDNGYKLKYYPKAVCWHYTYAEANEIKEVQYFGSTLANILIRMRYGTKAEIIEGLKLYKKLLNRQGLFFNQRRKQLRYFLRLIRKAPYFLFNRKKNKENTYKFLNWDYELIRDGSFYEYSPSKETKKPLVSVVMRTCCERNGFLQEAIESVKNQTYTNIELVVVEDGTTNAAEIVQNIKNDNISNVIYIPIQKAGRCHAGNVGLEATKGEYIVFLDDDDLFFADHLEVLVQAITDDPTIAACYSSSFEVPTNIISNEPLKYEEKSFSVIHREEFSRETMLHHNFIPIQSILFKRSLYEEYGGFDEDLDNLEDWNLWTRYSYLNDFKFVDKTTSLYRVPACPNILSARQDELDKFYQIATEKQKAFISSIKS